MSTDPTHITDSIKILFLIKIISSRRKFEYDFNILRRGRKGDKTEDFMKIPRSIDFDKYRFHIIRMILIILRSRYGHVFKETLIDMDESKIWGKIIKTVDNYLNLSKFRQAIEVKKEVRKELFGREEFTTVMEKQSVGITIMKQLSLGDGSTIYQSINEINKHFSSTDQLKNLWMRFNVLISGYYETGLQCPTLDFVKRFQDILDGIPTLTDDIRLMQAGYSAEKKLKDDIREVIPDNLTIGQLLLNLKKDLQKRSPDPSAIPQKGLETEEPRELNRSVFLFNSRTFLTISSFEVIFKTFLAHPMDIEYFLCMHYAMYILFVLLKFKGSHVFIIRNYIIDTIYLSNLKKLENRKKIDRRRWEKFKNDLKFEISLLGMDDQKLRGSFIKKYKLKLDSNTATDDDVKGALIKGLKENEQIEMEKTANREKGLDLTFKNEMGVIVSKLEFLFDLHNTMEGKINYVFMAKSIIELLLNKNLKVFELFLGRSGYNTPKNRKIMGLMFSRIAKFCITRPVNLEPFLLSISKSVQTIFGKPKYKPDVGTHNMLKSIFSHPFIEE